MPKSVLGWDFETSDERSIYRSTEADDGSGSSGCSAGSTQTSIVVVGGAHTRAIGEDTTTNGSGSDGGAG